MPAFSFTSLAIPGNDLIQALYRDFVIVLYLFGFPLLDEYVFEFVVIHSQNNVAEHLLNLLWQSSANLMSFVCS